MSVPAVDLGDLVAPHPHRVELSGPLKSLAFPERCANCATPASGRVLVRKVFARNAGRHRVGRRRYRGYLIDSVMVPYCPACTARDARERDSTAARWRARLPALLVQSIPAVPCLGFASFLFLNVGVEGSLLWGLALLFGVWGVGLVLNALWETRRYLVPRQTEVTLAFDFGPDIADLLDPGPRRVYAMRDAAFAVAFTALNRERIWQPDPAAERTEMRVWIACFAFLLLAALAALVLNR